jgi:hypothetical protein
MPCVMDHSNLVPNPFERFMAVGHTLKNACIISKYQLVPCESQSYNFSDPSTSDRSGEDEFQ